MRGSAKRKKTTPTRDFPPGTLITQRPLAGGVVIPTVSPLDGSGIVKTPSLGGASLAENASSELLRIERNLS